jgi:ribosomal protein S18 acetylase RimI-like enzyme
MAIYNDLPAGCVGLKRFDDTSCEMKRLYVNLKFRGLKIGDRLCEEIIRVAKNYGYTRMLLDTNVEMHEAVRLYHKYNFTEIEAYCRNGNKNPLYFSREL